MFDVFTEWHTLDPKMSVFLPSTLYLAAIRLTSMIRCNNLQTYHQYLAVVTQLLITGEL
jgi:hypothetical protein